MNNIITYLPLALLLTFLVGCGGNQNDPEPTCSTPPDVSIISSQPASGCNSQDGEISVSGTGGTEPLEYSIDGVSFQESTTFSGLAGGSYTVTVRDAQGCTNTTQATVDIGGGGLNATPSVTADTQCVGGNGSITVNASGGEPPYSYNIGSGFVDQSTFNNLNAGTYDIIVRDINECTFNINVAVEQGDTNTSYADDVQSIILVNCAVSGCHNGDNGRGNFLNLSEVQANADDIKSRTQSGNMPPSGTLSDSEIALITCWVDEGANDN